MAHQEPNEHLSFIQRVKEVPTVYGVTSSVNEVYGKVKSANFLISYGLYAVETAGLLFVSTVVEPVLKKLKGPIEVADGFGCAVFDGAKEKFPVFFKPPGEIVKSSSSTLTNSSIVQAMLYFVDVFLLLVEKSVTLFPEFSVEHVEAEDDDKESTLAAVSSALSPIRTIYSAATYPLRIVGKTIHSQRKKIHRLQRRASHPRRLGTAVRVHKKTAVRKPSSPKGLFGRIIVLPVRALNWIGVLAEERSMLKLNEDPDIAWSPTLKTRHLTAHVEEDEHYLNTLGNLDDYLSSDDPDYEPEESDDDVDSFEYNSGSCRTEDGNQSQNIDANTSVASAASPTKPERASPKSTPQSVDAGRELEISAPDN